MSNKKSDMVIFRKENRYVIFLIIILLVLIIYPFFKLISSNSSTTSRTTLQVNENNVNSTIFALDQSRKSINSVTSLTEEESIKVLQQLEYEPVDVSVGLFAQYADEQSIIKVYNPTKYYFNGISFFNDKIKTSKVILAPDDYAYLTVNKRNVDKVEDRFIFDYFTTTDPIQEVIYPSDFTNNELVIEEDRNNRIYNIKINSFPEKYNSYYSFEQENMFFVNYKYNYNNEYNEDSYFINLSEFPENYKDELIPIFNMNKKSELANDDFQLLNFHFNGCFAKRS